MSLKIGLNLTEYYSINFDLPKRNKKLIKFIIIHYTGMRNENKAIQRLSDSNSKVSSHYFIKNSGDVLNLVPDLFTAWHAGNSYWKQYKSLNRYSIGIEINNPGHDNGYKRFTSKQISSLIKLLKFLSKKYAINKRNILGHSDISPNRKKDPGEKFPWIKLAKQKLCHWHYLDERKIKKYRNLKIEGNEEKTFFNNLYKIGYSRIFDTKSKSNKTALTIAFQRKFRQKLVNGKIDKECLLISKILIKF